MEKEFFMEVGNFTGTGIFIIVERLYDFLSPKWNNIGVSNTQVYRVVYQLYKKIDVYLDGKKIDTSTLSLWQRVKIFSGHPLVKNPSLDNSAVFSQDYSGSIIFTTPLSFPGIHEKILPRFMTENYRIPTGKFFAYGTDPIPHVLLYKRPEARFIKDNGGIGDPICAAKYDSNTKQIKFIDPINELPSLMRALTQLK